MDSARLRRRVVRHKAADDPSSAVPSNGARGATVGWRDRLRGRKSERRTAARKSVVGRLLRAGLLRNSGGCGVHRLHALLSRIGSLSSPSRSPEACICTVDADNSTVGSGSVCVFRQQPCGWIRRLLVPVADRDMVDSAPGRDAPAHRVVHDAEFPHDAAATAARLTEPHGFEVALAWVRSDRPGFTCKLKAPHDPRTKRTA